MTTLDALFGLVRASLEAVERSQVPVVSPQRPVDLLLRCTACGEVAQVITHKPDCWAKRLYEALTRWRTREPLASDEKLVEAAALEVNCMIHGAYKRFAVDSYDHAVARAALSALDTLISTGGTPPTKEQP